jgi:catechol 2,3-dioxygenase-like lactoylglutathione lyase family enzyme
VKTLAFSFTKVVVRDLDRSESFYRDVFGMVRIRRLTATEHQFAAEEVTLSLSGADTSHVLVLMHYLRRSAPPTGAAWLGFIVADIDATLAAIEQSNGRIEVRKHHNAEHGVYAALGADPDGHMIEIIMLAAEAPKERMG